MTTEDVRRRLVRIGSAARAGQLESAAKLERELFVSVLQAVAAGTAGSAEAMTALTSLQLEFRRSA